MRVWLLHIGEELPVDGDHRWFRYSYLAKALEDAGHEVLRWAPTFRHVSKTYRFLDDHHVAVSSRYSIRFVHGPGYSRNAGLERLRTYRVLGHRFRDLALRETRPDVIVAAIPSLEWAEAAVDYARAHDLPVIVDVRDLWPDVFLNVLPRLARPTGRLLLAPYYRMAQRACGRATAITGVSESYVDWGLRLAGRTRGPADLTVPLGFEPRPADSHQPQEHVAQLRRLGIDPARHICMFAGLFERSYDLETVLKAAQRLLSMQRSDIQFVLCGEGSKSRAIRRLAAGIPTVVLPGWLDAALLQALTSVAAVGLCAYASDALQSLPNKPFDYMAGGLAIISSLQGEMPHLLDRHQCGLTYPPGDADALAHCILQVVDDAARLRTLRENSRQAWLENYRSVGIYARFAGHLESLVAKPRKAA